MVEGRLCERGTYERVACERVACEKVVCEQVVCEKVCVCVFFSNTPFPRKVSCAPQHEEDTCWPPYTEVLVKNPSMEQVTVTQKLLKLEKAAVKRQPVSCICQLTGLCSIAMNSCSAKPCFFFLKHHRGWHLFVAALLFVVLSPFFLIYISKRTG